MARINIEERWWTDPRRSALMKRLKSEELTDGCMIKAWRTAQEYWKKDKSLIPVDIFNLLEGSVFMFEVGLASVRDGSVYVRGSSEHLDWARTQSEINSEKGKKSVEARRKKNGTAQPKPRTDPEPTPNQPRTEFNRIELSGSGSDSGSVSDSGSISFSYENDAKIEILPPDKGNFLIRTYCEGFRSKHGSNPDITKQDAGIAKRLSATLSQQRITTLIAAYFAMPEAWLQKAKHPLTLFESKLKEVSVFADSGAFVTRKQVQQADSRVTTQTMLQMVDEGKI